MRKVIMILLRFLSKYVLNGAEYDLWEVDEEERQALLFQKVDDNPIYFSRDAMLTLHWDEEGRSDKLRAKYVWMNSVILIVKKIFFLLLKQSVICIHAGI